MSGPHVTPFDSEAGFGKALDTVIAAAREEICVFARDLGRMPLEDPQRTPALHNFLLTRSDNRLRIVLHDMQRLQDRSPRLQTLLRTFVHAIELRQTPSELHHLADCCLLSGDGCGVIRFHYDHPRGKLILGSPAELRAHVERFREIWEASTPFTTGTPLGL